MRGFGAGVRELEPVQEGGEEPMRAFLDEIRDNLFSWTWKVPEDVRLRAVAELEPWAQERWGDLDEVRRFDHATVWRAYDLP
jgi:hypothetical protein